MYRAHDLRNDRSVALKVLRPEFAGSVSGERFRREIEILSRLSHPHIVSLLDWGDADGSPWYAMPLVRGDNLRARLDREGQLAIDEAVSIARQVAEALAHAHAADVVHRDIKPGNILLEDGNVLVADFGIARAITQSAEAQFVSSSGVLIGTPAYMSPEQASARREIDGRSDIYALGCVLYEMLAGEPPFSGPSPAAITARHVMDPVPPLTTVRSSVPESLAKLVYRMLAKSPADRFATANDLLVVMDAVERDPSVSVADHRKGMRPWTRASLAGAAAIVLAVGGWSAWSKSARASEAKMLAEADTTLLAAFPVEGDSTLLAHGNIEQAMRHALTSWQGMRIVSTPAIEEAAKQHGGPLSASTARTLALSLHAGRYMRTMLTRDDSAVRASVSLFDVSNAALPLFEASEQLGRSTVASDSSLARLVAKVLLRTTSPETAKLGSGTSSLPARQAYLRGRSALEQWNLEAADSAFVIATGADPAFASGWLWLALTRQWAQKDSSKWYYASTSAEKGEQSLAPNERVMSGALTALRRGDRPAACALWDQLARQAPSEFEGWYGAAECLARDNRVLPDPGSRSGWKFRSGYNAALIRYREAFERRPSVLAALRRNDFERVRRLLWTTGADVRSGESADTVLSPAGERRVRVFQALPSWEHDTIAFIPFPAELFSAGDRATLRRLPATIGRAVRKQRELFHDIASGWVAAQPRSADAVETLAYSLFLLGEPTALDTLLRAKALAAGDPARLQRITAREVWMRVQAALPGDLTALRLARQLADSLVRANAESPAEPRTLASVAALTGHAFAAQRIDSHQRSSSAVLPPAALVPWRNLTVLAAFGGPADSLRAGAHRIDSLISAKLPAAERSKARMEAFGRAAFLSYPETTLDILRTGEVSNNYIVSADAAWVRGDTAMVRRILTDQFNARAAFEAAEISTDVLYPEAWLTDKLGDARAAAARLDKAFGQLHTASALGDPVRAAMLVRAMAFRAELANRAGDGTTAAQWAGAVIALWSGGDEFLTPVIRQMQRFVH